MVRTVEAPDVGRRELRRSPLNLNLLVEALEVLGRDIRFRLSISRRHDHCQTSGPGKVLDDVFRGPSVVAVCIPAAAARKLARMCSCLGN